MPTSNVSQHKPHWTELPPVWRWFIGSAIQAGDVALKLGCVALIGASTWVMLDKDANQRFTLRNPAAVAMQTGGTYVSPIVGKPMQALVDYQPSHGQSFGPETGNQRKYGPHGGVDFDCRVGGCAGANVASPISGRVSEIRKIGTSANGASYQVHIQGQDWQGAVEHQLVHVDHIAVAVGDTVTAGQVVAKVSPTDSVSTGPHLDWKIKRNGQWVNPQRWAADAQKQATTAGGDALGQIDLAFIKNLEGYHPCAYPDGAQVSWGYGTKAPGLGHCISSKAQAEAEMVAYIQAHCLPILPDNVAQHPGKATAAISLCFNAGAGVVEWDIWQHMEAGRWDAVRFTNYTRSTTGHSLMNRRTKEQAKWEA